MRIAIFVCTFKHFFRSQHMKNATIKILRSVISVILIFILILGLLYGVIASSQSLRDQARELTEGTSWEPLVSRLLPGGAEHDHEEEFTSQEQAVEVILTPTALKNIGLDDSAIVTIEPADYYKSFTIPAMVVERPGFSTITVPAPVSGVITKIHHETGIAIRPGEPMFDILLNQQELVKAQMEYLSLLKKREINNAEFERLAGLDPQIVPKQQREISYVKIQLDRDLEIQKNVLLLQGLSETDISESLEKNSRIVRNMTIHAPPINMDNNITLDHDDDPNDHTFTIEELYITTGKNVEIGDSLCRLSDYCELAIQGKAFAIQEKEINDALKSKSRVAATFEGISGNRETVENLVLRSVDNRIDAANGSLLCYVDLHNRETTYEVGPDHNSRRYTQWHYKPGQRCELNIEYEQLLNCIVLPIDAVAKDLQDMCVFQWVGVEEGDKIWRKVPVHVLYKTKDVVVIANDGTIPPGAKVAKIGAGMILAALDAANQKAAGGGGGIQHGDHVH